MALIKIRSGLPYVKTQGQDMCLYAGVEILLKYNGVNNLNQHDLFAIDQSRIVQNIALTLRANTDLKNLIIEYPAP